MSTFVSTPSFSLVAQKSRSQTFESPISTSILTIWCEFFFPGLTGPFPVFLFEAFYPSAAEISADAGFLWLSSKFDRFDFSATKPRLGSIYGSSLLKKTFQFASSGQLSYFETKLFDSAFRFEARLDLIRCESCLQTCLSSPKLSGLTPATNWLISLC